MPMHKRKHKHNSPNNPLKSNNPFAKNRLNSSANSNAVKRSNKHSNRLNNNHSNRYTTLKAS